MAAGLKVRLFGASEAWTAVDAGESATAETKHLLIYAPRAMEKRLKAIGALLEKYHDLAIEAVRRRLVPHSNYAVQRHWDRLAPPAYAGPHSRASVPGEAVAR